MTVVVPALSELFEEAYERAGLEMRSGYDLKTARRSLNIMTLEWQNRGLNLFTIEAGTLPLVAGTATYTLPADTIDLIEHQLRTGSGTSQLDAYIERMSVSTYSQQGSKNVQGRPSQIYVQRNATDVQVTLWPVPDATTSYTLAYYRLKGIDGLSAGIGGATQNIPPRFVPALVSGLAYYIAMKKPEVADRVIPLQQEYEKQFAMAADQDQDRSTLRIVPFAVGGMCVGYDIVDPDQPQNFLGQVNTTDPQSLLNPRPDSNPGRGLFGWNPIWNPAQHMVGSVGTLTVITT